MSYTQYYTQENWLLIHIFGELAARLIDVTIKPLSDITIDDLTTVHEMPVPPDGIIVFDMKSGDKRSGNLEFTVEMKNNLVRFAKENAKEYLQSRQGLN